MPKAAGLIGLAGLLGIAACGSAPAPRSPEAQSPALPGASPSAAPLAAQGPYLPDAILPICNGNVTNAPARRAGDLADFSPLIQVGPVILASVPANNACISSGFGPRFGRNHDGIDLKAEPASMVFSAGPGIIAEVDTASGYGYFVVIDHGGGVFTRYAHLSGFEPGIVAGARIGFGQALGLMGRTGNATAIHLHYEVLTGDWGPRRSWGLTPTDPLSWPAYDPDGLFG